MKWIDRLERKEDGTDYSPSFIDLEVKADGDSGEITGYGSVFGNVDHDGDIIQPGAFVESLKDRMPAMLWQHDTRQPIGVWESVQEDAKGLLMKGRLVAEGKGKEALALLKAGALKGLSVGFISREAMRDDETGIRTITKADLYEVSVVTFPANEMAGVLGVKASDIRSKTDLERHLRKAGASRTEAKEIAHNFIPRSDLELREAVNQAADIKALLKR